MSKSLRRMLYYMLIPTLFIILFIYYEFRNIPTIIFLKENQNIKQNIFLKISNNKRTDRNASINLLGIVPVGSVPIKPVNSNMLIYPGGQPIGVKLNTKGVLVVALSDITVKNAKITSPAALAGLQIGDNILKINETTIKDAEQTRDVVNKSQGQNIKVLIERKGQKLEKIIKPVKNMDDGSYKIGLWIRDSTAGIGTLTFYDKNSKMFAALGHPIIDIDTGTILNINSGEIVSSSIVSVKKGIKGNPGELKGIFVNEESILGNIYKNTECGVFGKGNAGLQNNNLSPMRIGLRNEIKEGPAKILTTIDKSGVKAYDIKIEKLLVQDSPGPKSMVIRVTDKNLLEKTGGIVQGMSGSPIIQNGKIVGAVTHVLVNKPDVGYGIYIEWMLNDANLLTK